MEPFAKVAAVPEEINQDIYLDINHGCKIKKKNPIDIQQEMQDAQANSKNLSLLSVTTGVKNNNKNICPNENQPISLDDWGKDKILNKTDLPIYSHTSSLLNNNNIVQNSFNSKINQGMAVYERLTKPIEISQKQSMKKKRIISDSESDDFPVFKTRRRCNNRISSDSHDDSNVSDAIIIVEDDSSSDSCSNYETIKNQEISRTINEHITRELHVTLTRLEEMDDIDIIKWRKNKARNTLLNIISQLQAKKQQSKIIYNDQKTRRRNLNRLFKKQSKNEIEISNYHTVSDRTRHKNIKQNPRDRSDLVKINYANLENNYKDSSESEAESVICIEEHYLKESNSASNVKKSKDKYELLKRAKVLLIKLENLKLNCSEDGRYSTTQVDCLTHNYINSVMNFKYLEIPFYERAHLRREMNESVTQKDHTEATVSNDGDRLFYNHSAAEESATNDDEVMENSDGENTSFKLSNELASNCNKSKSDTLKNDDSSSQKSLLEIWRNAFCIEYPARENRKEAKTAKQSTEDSKTAKQSTEDSKTGKQSTEDSKTAKQSTEDSKTAKQSTEDFSTILYDKDASKENVSDPSLILNKNILEQPSLKKLSEKTDNVKTSMDNTTSKNVKITEICNSIKKIQCIHKCNICKDVFNNYGLLQQHVINVHLCSTRNKNVAKISKLTEIIESEKAATNKTDKCNSENIAEISKSPQCSFTDNKNDNHGADQSFSRPDKEIALLPASLRDEKWSKCHSIPQSKAIQLNKLIEKTVSKNPTMQSKPRITRVEHLGPKPPQNDVNKCIKLTCKVCSKTFNSYLQMSEHNLQHTNNELLHAYIPLNINTSSTRQNTDKGNDRSKETSKNLVYVVENRIDGQEIELRENLNESIVRNRAVVQNLPEARRDAIRESTFSSQAECMTDNEREERFETNNNEQRINDEREETNNVETPFDRSNFSLQLLRMLDRFMSVCECHKNEVVNNIQIEIALLCTTCHTLFRRFECFERHFRNAEKSTCAKYRSRRVCKLFCSACQAMLHSSQDLFDHLASHARLDPNGTVTFRCNICKVIFYEFGPVFKFHVDCHFKNPFFLANRSSFPKISCIGPKLVELSFADNNKQIEVYLQVADHACSECRMPFNIKEALNTHENICRGNAIRDVEFSDGEKLTSTVMLPTSSENRQILLICGFCEEKFSDRISFESHSLEHKQKRDLAIHYICMTVTNGITIVYVCKVCVTVCKSLNMFEEHWLTHGALLEHYICTYCKNHFNTIDQFQEHANTHNSNDKEEPVSCRVIYKDARNSCKTHLCGYVVIYDDLPCTNLSHFEKRQSSEKTAVEDKSSAEAEKLVFPNSESDNARIVNKDGTCNNNAAKTLEDIAVDGKQCSDIATIIVSAEICSDAGESVNTDNVESNLIIFDKSEVSEATYSNVAGVSVSENNESSIGDKSGETSTVRDDEGVATNLDDTATMTNSSSNNVENVPKSFLRVKSLAELNNFSGQKHFKCHKSDCDSSFDSVQEWVAHQFKCQYNLVLVRKNKQTTSSDNTTESRSKFNPAVPKPPARAIPPLSKILDNNTPCSASSSSAINQPVNHQLINVKPIHVLKQSANNTNPNKTVQQKLRLMSKQQNCHQQPAQQQQQQQNYIITLDSSQIASTATPLLSLAAQRIIQNPVNNQDVSTRIVQPTLQISELGQPSQQSNSTVTIRPSQNTIVQSVFTSSPTLYQFPSDQNQTNTSIINLPRNYMLIQSTPTQQSVNNNVLNMPYLIASVNDNRNSMNNVNMTVNRIQQISNIQDSEGYLCESCPTFKFNSLRDFSSHIYTSIHQENSRRSNADRLNSAPVNSQLYPR